MLSLTDIVYKLANRRLQHFQTNQEWFLLEENIEQVAWNYKISIEDLLKLISIAHRTLLINPCLYIDSSQ